MSGKIIKPEGDSLLYYRNNGFAICNKCGALMDREEAPARNGCENWDFVCPSCGWTVDMMDYEYEDDEKEWTSEMLESYGGDVPPAGCRACGGPYPDCTSSCSLFDD